MKKSHLFDTKFMDRYDRLLQKIAKNIKSARKKKCLTQEDMTNYGFNYRYYQRIESGKYSMNLYTLHRLALVFKIPLTELLSDAKPK